MGAHTKEISFDIGFAFIDIVSFIELIQIFTSIPLEFPILLDPMEQ